MNTNYIVNINETISSATINLNNEEIIDKESQYDFEENESSDEENDSSGEENDSIDEENESDEENDSIDEENDSIDEENDSIDEENTSEEESEYTNEKNIKLIINENYLLKQHSIKGKNVIIENIMKYNTGSNNDNNYKNPENDENNIFNIIKDQDEYSKNLLLELYKKYKIKNLRLISQYYNLNKSKYKEKIINNIIDYELDLVNLITVKNRFILWEYLYLLKNDIFFNKKINIL